MIENFNDLMSLIAILFILVLVVLVAVRLILTDESSEDEQDFFREIL